LDVTVMLVVVNVLVVGVVLVALKNIGGYISTGGTKSICVRINEVVVKLLIIKIVLVVIKYRW